MSGCTSREGTLSQLALCEHTGANARLSTWNDRQTKTGWDGSTRRAMGDGETTPDSIRPDSMPCLCWLLRCTSAPVSSWRRCPDRGRNAVVRPDFINGLWSAPGSEVLTLGRVCWMLFYHSLGVETQILFLCGVWKRSSKRHPELSYGNRKSLCFWVRDPCERLKARESLVF